MPAQTFIVNGERIEVDVEDDVRLLWVLRDLLGVTGPKYGCGLSICQACTSQINGTTFNPCAVPVGELKRNDHVTTIEGLAATVDETGPNDLHPVQEVWLEQDVAQCGFCQPGQIMAAVGLIEESRAAGRSITDDDLDQLRNVCRCGTYPRVRTAIRAAAERPWKSKLPKPEASDRSRASVDDQDPTIVAARTGAPTTASLPATGTESVLGPAAVAAGTAVAVRVASNRGSSRAVPAQADAGEAERRDPDG